MHYFPNNLKTDKHISLSASLTKEMDTCMHKLSRDECLWEMETKFQTISLIHTLLNIIKTKCIQIGPETEQSHQEDCGRKLMQEGAAHAKGILTVTSVFYMPSSPR